ncbi:hypothetical protein CN586_07455 [Bacillus toyonensis]|uniref:hypothetical protein n=1 Tax=Bacillus toyonensis TaxID=155322 RepID=UPI000BF15410|nr:hypothetical protein [Bacillus toyonensis]PEK52687.1 hypothetical protein CN586_07455 [Bacillus toyonensis]PEM47925.1 hypothetical protein CN636_03730 [Bacillus toyonensis]
MKFSKAEREEHTEGLFELINEKPTQPLEFIKNLKEEANKYFRQAEKHFREFIILVVAHKENEKEADEQWILWEDFNEKGICLQEEAKKLYIQWSSKWEVVEE